LVFVRDEFTNTVVVEESEIGKDGGMGGGMGGGGGSEVDVDDGYCCLVKTTSFEFVFV
jgi:hypothetical protein